MKRSRAQFIAFLAVSAFTIYLPYLPFGVKKAEAYTGAGGVWATKSGDFVAKYFAGTPAGAQAGVDYLGSAGGGIQFAAGVYAFGTSTLTIPYGKVKLLGAGNRSTKFTYSGTGDFITLGTNDGDHSGVPDAYDGTSSQCVIQDIWIEGPGSGTTARAIVDWDSGSNQFERLTISGWGTGYFGIGADVSHFTDVYWQSCGTGTHLASRSDQNQFDNCYWAQNTFGLRDEYAANTRIIGGQFVFSDSADIVCDAPAAPTQGGDIRGDLGLVILGTWFESGTSYTGHDLDRHIWFGKDGTSSRLIKGLSIFGAWVQASTSVHFIQIDGGNGVVVYGVRQVGVLTQAAINLTAVSGVFPNVVLGSNNWSTNALYDGAGYGNTQSSLEGLRSINAVSYGASLTVNGGTAGDMVQISALTGNITINAPSNPAKGKILIFVFTQDGTGGRTVTWDAVFKHAWSDTGNTANKRSTIQLYYDGSSWIQIGAQSPYL